METHRLRKSLAAASHQIVIKTLTVRSFTKMFERSLRSAVLTYEDRAKAVFSCKGEQQLSASNTLGCVEVVQLGRRGGCLDGLFLPAITDLPASFTRLTDLLHCHSVHIAFQ